MTHPVLNCVFFGQWSLKSDITYEELTPTANFFNNVFAILNVGHYLWGIDTKKLVLPFFVRYVGHYLWGIDTIIIFSFLSSFLLQVGHYLWGIDTLGFYTIVLFHRRTLPMRNWHVQICLRFLHFQVCRTLPMRNWHQ